MRSAGRMCRSCCETTLGTGRSVARARHHQAAARSGICGVVGVVGGWRLALAAKIRVELSGNTRDIDYRGRDSPSGVDNTISWRDCVLPAICRWEVATRPCAYTSLGTSGVHVCNHGGWLYVLEMASSAG